MRDPSATGSKPSGLWPHPKRIQTPEIWPYLHTRAVSAVWVGFKLTWPYPCKPEPSPQSRWDSNSRGHIPASLSRPRSFRHAQPLSPTAQVGMVLADWVCIPLVTFRAPCFLTSYQLLVTSYQLLVTSYQLLPTTYYLLLTTYYLLLTITTVELVISKLQTKSALLPVSSCQPLQSLACVSWVRCLLICQLIWGARTAASISRRARKRWLVRSLSRGRRCSASQSIVHYYRHYYSRTLLLVHVVQRS